VATAKRVRGRSQPALRTLVAVVAAAALGVFLLIEWLRPEPRPVDGAVLVGAGDIADCSEKGHQLTADLLDSLPGTVATFGDNAYEEGRRREFRRCYDPHWGRHRERTRPAVGNHEYGTEGARPYFEYFGARAGRRGEGWYSYDLAEWHIVVLNSNCGEIDGGCRAGSPQLRWLEEDLAASDARCTLAYWHHPRFSSGVKHGSYERVAPFWDVLYEHGAEVVLAGHEHHYERFAPQTPAGRRDPRFGIRQFVVGTGGNDAYGFGNAVPTSERRATDLLGVIRLDLKPGRYEWRFVSAEGDDFTDRGTGECHGRPDD
jgi:alkaline phosphatase